MKLKLFCFVIILIFFMPIIGIGQIPDCTDGTCPIPTIRQNNNKYTVAVVRAGYKSQQKGNHYFIDWGSGTIIANNGTVAYVLTCWHTFRDGWPNGRPLVYVGKEGFWGKIEKIDKANDLVLLKIKDPRIKPTEIAVNNISVGELVTTVGFPSGQYRATAGRVLSVSSDVVVVSGAIGHGGSGGPVLNAQGHIVAGYWGGREGNGYCTPLPKIRAFIRGILNPPSKPLVEVTPPPLVKVTPPPLVKVGPSGRKGDTGPIGPKGDTATIDLDALVEALKDKIEIPVQNDCRELEIRIDRNTREIEFIKKALSQVEKRQKESDISIKNLGIESQRTNGNLESLTKRVNLQDNRMDQLLASQKESSIQIKELILLMQKSTKSGVSTGQARFKLWLDQNRVIKVEPVK